MQDTKGTIITSVIKMFKMKIAREIILMCVVTFVSLLILAIGAYLHQNNESKLKQLNDDKNNISNNHITNNPFLWYTLQKNNVYTKDYKEFLMEFNKSKEQIFLYRLVSNAGLYTKSLDEFRMKYFRYQMALDDCISLHYEQPHLSEHDMRYQNESFWISHDEKVVNIKLQLQNNVFLDDMYQKFVLHGYGQSKEEFKKLVLEQNVRYLKETELEDLQRRIDKINIQWIPKTSIHFKSIAENIIYSILIIIYPVRLIIVLILWSFKQAKIK